MPIKKSFDISFIIFLLFLIIVSLFINNYLQKEPLTTQEDTTKKSCTQDIDCNNNTPGTYEFNFNAKMTQDNLVITKINNNLKCVDGLCK
jgi:hypothetical protein